MINRERSTPKLRNDIRDLHHLSSRDVRKEFLVEGPHACDEFLRAGIVPSIVVVVDEPTLEIASLAMQCRQRGYRVVDASESDLLRMGTTRTSQGILMVVPYFTEAAVGRRIIALDGVADPGNVGTILRTAVWFGCTDIVLSSDCADIYNPKVVRSSAGALSAINVLRRHDLSQLLQQHADGISIAAVAHGGVPPSNLADSDQWCLVIGSEAHGVSPEVLAGVSTVVTIPHAGSGVESLNAAVAASILLYELSGTKQ